MQLNVFKLPSMIQEPLAPQPVHTPTKLTGNKFCASYDRKAAASPSRPTVMTLSYQRIQKPRNWPASKIPGVWTSTTSGFWRFFLITDLVLSQPPMKTSYMGSASTGDEVSAKWASCAARTLNVNTPPETGWNWYSNLSGVLISVQSWKKG